MTENNDTTPSKHCKKCKRDLPATNEYFTKSSSSKDGFYHCCKECRGLRFGIHQKPIRPASRDGYKVCSKCDQEFPSTTEFFHKHNEGIGGLRPDCKACFGNRCAEYQSNHREHINALNRDLYSKNLNRERERRRMWRRQNPEKTKESYDRWRRQNLEVVRKRAVIASRDYRKKNPEKIRLQAQRYRRQNPEKRRTIRQRREARKRSLPDTLTHTQWLSCLEHFNNRCVYCGEQRDFWHPIEAEHFIPISSPDCTGTIATNIVPSCRACNASKSDTPVAEWLTRKFGKKRAAEILERIDRYFALLKDLAK